MRRRDLIAGIAGAAVLGGGAIGALGLSGDDQPDRTQEAVALAGIEATGSTGGTLKVPIPDRPTFLDIFATTCRSCQRQMPELRAAHDRLSDEVAFVSVTPESESAVDDTTVAEWWDVYDGNWQIVRDETRQLVIHYSLATPTGVLFDADGRVHWQDTGSKTESEIVEAVRSNLPE